MSKHEISEMVSEDIFDDVKCPKHYAGDGSISCMRAMQSMMCRAETRLRATQIYWWGCAFKYLWRFLWKNGIQDLDKCKRCIDYLIDDIHLKGMNNGAE